VIAQLGVTCHAIIHVIAQLGVRHHALAQLGALRPAPFLVHRHAYRHVLYLALVQLTVLFLDNQGKIY